MPSPSVFDEDTRSLVHGAAIADIADTADATYSANEQTMLGNLKAQLNSLLAACRSAGIIAQD